MRRVQGFLKLPAEVPSGARGRIRVEVRDVSQADAPSTVVASIDLDDVELQPEAQVPFDLQAPEGAAHSALAVRAQADAQTSGGLRSIYLTTESFSVPTTGDVRGLSVALRKT
jgi:putative lipoprotein